MVRGEQLAEMLHRRHAFLAIFCGSSYKDGHEAGRFSPPWDIVTLSSRSSNKSEWFNIEVRKAIAVIMKAVFVSQLNKHSGVCSDGPGR